MRKEIKNNTISEFTLEKIDEIKKLLETGEKSGSELKEKLEVSKPKLKEIIFTMTFLCPLYECKIGGETHYGLLRANNF